MGMSFFNNFIIFFIIFFLVISAEKLKESKDECAESRCNVTGPPIRFPFRLKDRQPAHCGYRGFDISCTTNNETLFELPNSLRFFIDNIDYKLQTFRLIDPEGCPQKHARRLNSFSLPSSPFQFINFQYNYSLFNCSLSSSTRENFYFRVIPCLSNSGFKVMAADYDGEVTLWLPLSYCTKMYTVYSVPSDLFYNDKGSSYGLSLSWSQPMCGNCEASGGICRWKNDYSMAREIECFHKKKNIGAKLAVAGAVLGSFSLLVIAAGFYYVHRKHRQKKENQAKIEQFLEDYRAHKPVRYSYADIKRITNKFEDKLGTIHHVNVVRLVGYCADGYRRALVFDFLPNESLEKFIFMTNDGNPSLGWEKLHNIALGIAKGIEYLHQAKLCSKDQSYVSMTAARGTVGYMAPEVFSRNFGNVSYKSDVYSFGMLLLEMVGGRKIGMIEKDVGKVSFPEWVYNHLDQRERQGIQIEDDWDASIAKKLTIVGLWCIQWYPVDRPPIKAVVQMLEGQVDNLIMPPNPFSSMGLKNAAATIPEDT
ncbi:Wall-associated receptor kinase, galacturonan-binding domain [Dillenia turbinata]|uniref:Wall-associated receptor kinase, galacturonan-binding domain n=1 Tax=Dillenia turbinata TaxID=194707 RepID=A0AAN8W069_9MAGN